MEQKKDNPTNNKPKELLLFDIPPIDKKKEANQSPISEPLFTKEDLKKDLDPDFEKLYEKDPDFEKERARKGYFNE